MNENKPFLARLPKAKADELQNEWDLMEEFLRESKIKTDKLIANQAKLGG